MIRVEVKLFARARDLAGPGPLSLELPDGATVESLRGTILKLGLLTEAELDNALAECRRHLARDGTSFTMFTLAQSWGRTSQGRTASG